MENASRFQVSDQMGIYRALVESGFMSRIKRLCNTAQDVSVEMFRDIADPVEAIITLQAICNQGMEPYDTNMTTRPGYQIACRAGCWWCCTRPVQCRIPEIILIAIEVLRWEEPKRLALIERLKQYKTSTQGKKVKQIDSKRLMCPLLIDNACSVYAVRPNACVKFTSYDASVCETAYKSRWSHVLEGPDNIVELHALHDFMQYTIEDIGTAHGLDMRPMNLSLALLILLTVDDADEQWRDGKPIFESALWPL